MKILIDIPKEFEVDYNTDRFANFFQRCLADMGTSCGNYEQETAEMMEKAFEKSRLYDTDKVVKQLEKKIQTHKRAIEYEKKNGTITEEFQQAFEIRKNVKAAIDNKCKRKRYAEILTLKYINGMPDGGIADEYKKDVRTIKNVLRTAIESLDI